jgi:hypothetical protein
VTKLAGTAGCLIVVAAGAMLVVAVPSSAPGLVVMLAGTVGLAVVLVRSLRRPGRIERPRRERAVPLPDPDRAYFDALHETPPGSGPRPGAGQR